ncbi:MAG: signal peptidase II [Planctomycetes bacterium]|nr:signal peptidase II [Planctomycetota bacterium]
MTADGVTGDREADGGRGFRGKLWFWLPWPLLVALDLWSKWWVFALLEREYPHVAAEPQRVHPVFRTELLRFDLVQWRNPGTIWGLFQDGTLALMVLRCCAIVGLFWFVYRTPRQKRLQLAVLSLILAGAIGNLYDNFFCPARSVRDFLYFTGSWPVDWSFPAFNIADSCITCGAIALFLLLWREDRAAAVGQTTDTQKAEKPAAAEE